MTHPNERFHSVWLEADTFIVAVENPDRTRVEFAFATVSDDGYFVCMVQAAQARASGATRASGTAALKLLLAKCREGRPGLVWHATWSRGRSPETGSTNFYDFVKARTCGASREEAVSATWSGQRAREFGFDRARVVVERDHRVEVMFESGGGR
jgi:hypothetical protein